MANLKELRSKISVIKSTRKVTSAMKLVAGVKLRKAEQKASASRDYACEVYGILSHLRRNFIHIESELFFGRKNEETVMLIVFASDKGLCGNFNYLINKEVIHIISDLHKENKKICVLCVGGKLFEILKQVLNEDDSIDLIADFYKDGSIYENSKKLADRIIADFQSNKVDRISVAYTRYYSAMKRKVEVKNLIPLAFEPSTDKSETIFEPDVDAVLTKILPYNITIQVYQCALESLASEQSSRMTSMDSATRNADDLISEFTIKYNRTRQYNITQELTEVISGAKAIAKG